MKESNQEIIRAILARPGEDPKICELPSGAEALTNAISDLLDGNFSGTEFFDLQNGASLFVLVNDFSVPLGLAPNRRFPGKDADEIIFGSAVFIAAYNESSGKDGVVDMPPRVCRMLIEQIKLNFTPCRGDEKPDERAEVYVENAGEPDERRFKWVETQKPVRQDACIPAGRAKMIRCGQMEFIEINGRYFVQAPLNGTR